MPSQQPVQLLLWQVPPQPSEAPWHLPLQLGVQLLPQLPLAQLEPCAAQLAQAAPPFPQALSAVPSSQTKPTQQPGQLLLLQVPPHSSAAPAHLPAQFGVHEEQVLSGPHLLPTDLVQSEHWAPSLPQAASVTPGVHCSPMQQPRQSLTWHFPPQPSSAPAHLPVQFGVQEARQVRLAALQTPPLAAQSTQAPPPLPQASLPTPERHWLFLQQPLGQLVELQPVLSGTHFLAWQSNPVSQLRHCAPPEPQALFWSPATHCVPKQQPLQLAGLHVVGGRSPPPSYLRTTPPSEHATTSTAAAESSAGIAKRLI